MITAHLNFLCKLCGFSEFYLMPHEEKTVSGDKVRSSTHFEMVCKKCKQSYLLELTVKTI